MPCSTRNRASRFDCSSHSANVSAVPASRSRYASSSASRRGHEPQLVDLEVARDGAQRPKPMLGILLPRSTGANSSALRAMSSSTVQRRSPASKSFARLQPRHQVRVRAPHHEHLAADVRRVIRREEADERRHVVRVPGVVLALLGPHELVRAADRRGHAGAGPRRDRVHRHAVLLHLAGEHERHRRDARPSRPSSSPGRPSRTSRTRSTVLMIRPPAGAPPAALDCSRQYRHANRLGAK